MIANRTSSPASRNARFYHAPTAQLTPHSSHLKADSRPPIAESRKQKPPAPGLLSSNAKEDQLSRRRNRPRGWLRRGVRLRYAQRRCRNSHRDGYVAVGIAIGMALGVALGSAMNKRPD